MEVPACRGLSASEAGDGRLSLPRGLEGMGRGWPEIVTVPMLSAKAVLPRDHRRGFGVMPGLSHYTAWPGGKWLFKSRQHGPSGGSVRVGGKNEGDGEMRVMGKWGSASTAASWGPWHSCRA